VTVAERTLQVDLSTVRGTVTLAEPVPAGVRCGASALVLACRRPAAVAFQFYNYTRRPHHGGTPRRAARSVPVPDSYASGPTLNCPRPIDCQ
jgi:hypothetical protein